MDLGLNLKKNEETLRDYGISTKFVTTGFIDVCIDYAFVRVSNRADSKALMLSMVVRRKEDMSNSNAVTQTLYDVITLTKSDGTPNDTGRNLLTKLCVVAGIDPEKIGETTTAVFEVNGEDKTFDCIGELTGVEFTGEFKQQFSLYNGKIYEKIRLDNVFRTSDKATAQEIEFKAQGKTDIELGKQFAKRSSVELKAEYLNGLSEDTVKDYYKNKNKEVKQEETVGKSILDD